MFINESVLTKKHDIKRIDGKFRYYQAIVNGTEHNMTSVTTILSNIDDGKIEELKNSMSAEVWEYVSKRGTSRGSVMHKYLELFLYHFHVTGDIAKSLEFTQTNTPKDSEVMSIYQNDIKFFELGRSLFYNFWYSGWFEKIKTVAFLEMPLYSLDYKYAGTSDYGYINFLGQFIVGDFKTSTRRKTDEEIKKYKIQISCYMQALYEMYGIKAEFGEITISYNEELEIFVVPFEDRFTYINDEFINTTNKLNKKLFGLS